MGKDYTIKEAFEELDKISSDLESEELEVEEMLPKYKRGLELIQFIKKRLSEVKIEIKKIKEEYQEIEKEEEDE
jgi:exodeoxyribonuclease VII small subunit